MLTNQYPLQLEEIGCTYRNWVRLIVGRCVNERGKKKSDGGVQNGYKLHSIVGHVPHVASAHHVTHVFHICTLHVSRVAFAHTRQRSRPTVVWATIRQQLSAAPGFDSKYRSN